MKIRLVFIYFLFFISSIYGDLIPNHRVITDSCSANDFNLVEGITYKIVHLRTGSSLDYNKDGRVYANSESSPYQYWVLRKSSIGTNKYNIINTKSGLNLDSNGRDIYISSNKDNNISNWQQTWIFTKIKDNIYNIVHVKSNNRNVDSDGENVYISDQNNNDKDNSYQQWLFEPSNYNLTAVVMDMEYPPDLKDKLYQYTSHANLLYDNYVINNDANALVEHGIDKVETKLNSYTFEVRKSESFKVTKNVVMSFNIGVRILWLLRINTGYAKGIKREFSEHHEKVYRESVTELVSYHISQKITVNPFSSVMVNSTVNKIRIKVPFKAKIRVTGKADRLDELLDKSGIVVSMTDVEVNALRCYLSKENYDINDITIEENSLLINTNGTLEVSGYGTEINFQSIDISKKPESLKELESLKVPEFPNHPASQNNYAIYLLLVLFITFIIIFILYKVYLRFKKNDYQITLIP